MVKRIGRMLDMDTVKDEALLKEVVENMDGMVFRDYIGRRSVLLNATIENGILNEGVDWLNASKPTGQSASRARSSVIRNAERAQRFDHTCTKLSCSSSKPTHK